MEVCGGGGRAHNSASYGSLELRAEEREGIIRLKIDSLTGCDDCEVLKAFHLHK